MPRVFFAACLVVDHKNCMRLFTLLWVFRRLLHLHGSRSAFALQHNNKRVWFLVFLALIISLELLCCLATFVAFCFMQLFFLFLGLNYAWRRRVNCCAMACFMWIVYFSICWLILYKRNRRVYCCMSDFCSMPVVQHKKSVGSCLCWFMRAIMLA